MPSTCRRASRWHICAVFMYRAHCACPVLAGVTCRRRDEYGGAHPRPSCVLAVKTQFFLACTTRSRPRNVRLQDVIVAAELRGHSTVRVQRTRMGNTLMVYGKMRGYKTAPGERLQRSCSKRGHDLNTSSLRRAFIVSSWCQQHHRCLAKTDLLLQSSMTKTRRRCGALGDRQGA